MKLKIDKAAVRCVAVVMTVILTIGLCISLAYAASDDATIIKEYTFTSKTDDFNYTDKDYIKIEGRTHKAEDIEYEILSEKKRIDEIRQYTDLGSQAVPKTIIDKDGVELALESVEYTPKNADYIQSYKDYVEAPIILDTVKFTASGKEITGKLISTERKLSESYNVPFTVTGKFYGDEDSMYYMLNEKQVPAETAPEFDQYRSELLAYLNLDPEIYRIDSGVWSSGYYDENGALVRTATYMGMQKSNSYDATYKGILYDATAVYSNGIKAEDGILYTVNAIVTYAPVLQAKHIAACFAGAIVLMWLMAFVWILFSSKKQTAKK